MGITMFIYIYPVKVLGPVQYKKMPYLFRWNMFIFRFTFDEHFVFVYGCLLLDR
jgi:hypothetical protein